MTTSISVSDSDFVYAMALQLDGKIVVAGLSENGWGTGVFALARYTSSGALDTGFDTDGKVTTSFGGTRETVRGLAIQSDGSIVAVGEQPGMMRGPHAETTGVLSGTLSVTGHRLVIDER